MSYLFDLNSEIYLPKKADNPIVAELLCNYTYGRKWRLIYNEKSNCISIGMCTEKEMNNSEYVLNITDEGIYIKGCDYSATMRGIPKKKTPFMWKTVANTANRWLTLDVFICAYSPRPQ